MNRPVIIIALTALALFGCGSSDNGSTSGNSVPSGTYSVDPSHTYLTFSYLHQGLSYPLLRATSINGELDYDAEDISNSVVSISVAADSIRTNIEHFDKELASRKFFNAEKYPYITFTTDSYAAINDSQGVLSGHVTIRNITHPLELSVTLNAAMIHPMLDIPVIGFSASGSLSRSDFGLDRFVPVVSDTVALDIEAEFLLGSNDESSFAAIQARAASAEQ